jgi:hypothetical protein
MSYASMSYASMSSNGGMTVSVSAAGFAECHRVGRLMSSNGRMTVSVSATTTTVELSFSCRCHVSYGSVSSNGGMTAVTSIISECGCCWTVVLLMSSNGEVAAVTSIYVVCVVCIPYRITELPNYRITEYSVWNGTLMQFSYSCILVCSYVISYSRCLVFSYVVRVRVGSVRVRSAIYVWWLQMADGRWQMADGCQGWGITVVTVVSYVYITKQ